MEEGENKSSFTDAIISKGHGSFDIARQAISLVR